MFAWVIEQIDGIVIRFPAIETKSEIGILHDEAPSLRKIYFCIIIRTPEHDIVAGEVDVAVEKVHHHDVQILTDVHPFLVLSQGMAFLAVEFLESLVKDIVAFLQFLDEQILIVLPFMGNLNLVNILKTVVVAIDIVFVRALTDIQHTHVLAVDIEHSRVASLPVEVYVRSHRTLDNKVAEVKVAEVITAIAERERLELGNTGFLVREELIRVTLVIGIEALVGIEYHRLEGISTRLTTLNACLTRLIDGTWCTLFGEELYVDRTAPVM